MKLYMAEMSEFESEQNGSKPFVLPLHHISINGSLGGTQTHKLKDLQSFPLIIPARDYTKWGQVLAY